MLTVFDGDPGLGKSSICLDLAARVSRGWAMPPRAGPAGIGLPASVLLLSAEDDPECTIRPRLDALEADCERVYLLEAVRLGDEDRPAVLPHDLDLVANHVRAWGIALVIVDPLFAYLSDDYDAHKDQSIRQALRRLALFARKFKVAVLVVRHLNKLSGGPALYRGGGSIGIVGQARAAWVVGTDPQKPETHVLAMNKINIAAPPRSLAYTLETGGNGAVRVGWKGETDMGPEDILGHERQGRPPAELQEAMDFLTKFLASGPQTARKVVAEAEEAGITERTLKRAKVRLRVESYKPALATGWVWSLPAKNVRDASRA